MITKNAIYGTTKDVVVIETGNGDIHMIGSEKDINGNIHLGMKTSPVPLPINVKFTSDVKSYDDFNPEIVFIFKNVESIDSIISMLQECKKDMLSTD